MEVPQKPPPSRKKFLLLGIAAFCSATILRFIPNRKVKKNSATVKMLTQDGKLVEIDRNLLGPAGKKISDKDLQQWVKK